MAPSRDLSEHRQKYRQLQILHPRTTGAALLASVIAIAVTAYIAKSLHNSRVMVLIAVLSAEYLVCALSVLFAPWRAARSEAATAAAVVSAAASVPIAAIAPLFVPVLGFWIAVAIRYQRRYRAAKWTLAVASVVGVGVYVATVYLLFFTTSTSCRSQAYC